MKLLNMSQNVNFVKKGVLDDGSRFLILTYFNIILNPEKHQE